VGTIAKSGFPTARKAKARSANALPALERLERNTELVTFDLRLGKA
jgi:hypothetical protein